MVQPYSGQDLGPSIREHIGSANVTKRPGNVHDSKQAVPFLRELIDDLRQQLGRRMILEFRIDAAFFQRAIFRLLAARGCGYAITVA